MTSYNFQLHWIMKTTWTGYPWPIQYLYEYWRHVFCKGTQDMFIHVIVTLLLSDDLWLSPDGQYIIVNYAKYAPLGV